MKAFFERNIILAESTDERKDPKKPKGTYCALRLSDQTKREIGAFLRSTGMSKVTTPIGADDMHCTLIYSRIHHPDMAPAPEAEHPATFRGYAVYHKSLVMVLDAESTESRHRELMAKHGCTYDFATYNPHVSIAYDIEPGFNVLSLPAYPHPIVLTGEYTEDLSDD
jgi:hypothetical protein